MPTESTTTSAAKVGDLVGEITAASNEQAQGIEQVNRATAEMDKVVQRVAANAQESASASQEMSSQAEAMKGVVARLVTLVGGTINGGVRAGHFSGSVKEFPQAPQNVVLHRMKDVQNENNLAQQYPKRIE